MKNTRKVIVPIFTLFVLLVAACSNNEVSKEADTTLTKTTTTQNENEDSTIKDSSDNASNTDITNTDANDTTTNKETAKEPKSLPAKETTSSNDNMEVDKKDEYLTKLNDAKKILDEMEGSDSSTYALKKVEDDRYEAWDELLNEVYGVLQEQLPTEKKEQLRTEQRNWIKFRDDSALEASLKYKGGTQEHLEYSAVSAALTEDRCFELVEEYMK
ncbi:lysozyme inhibitor LprI family protein [Bacillus sinesaloumensis]|uniref:lysozyme inhibitor LprI family protein n=1 Tax=Litchfieldia sinesaloumensis TaxID=1926280 RepID=UPI0009887182|nr:lysozyme inhibitor LprI family protein [Bacillus sinesaloumensis]